MDLECARAIYTPKDLSIINSPISRLRGTINLDFADVPEELVIWEEIYDWILKNLPPEMAEQPSLDIRVMGEEPGEGGQDKPEIVDSKSARELAIADANEQEYIQEGKQIQEEINSKLRDLSVRKSIASTVDTIVNASIGHTRSFSRPSRRPIDGILTRTDVRTDKRPQVLLYVDRSGSFSPEKTKVAEERIQELIHMYGYKLQLSTYYFGNSRLSNTDDITGGNTPYHLVANHISQHKPKLAIIITDDDASEPYVAPEGVNVGVIEVDCSSRALNNWDLGPLGVRED
jgi:hypothetical protein